MKTIDGDRGVISLSISKDGKTLLSGCYGGDIRLRDLESQKIVGAAAFPGPHPHVAFSPNGHVFLAGSDYALCTWTVAGAKEFFERVIEQKKFDNMFLLGRPVTLDSRSRIYSLALSPDGQFALTGTEKGATLWNLSMGKVVGYFLHGVDINLSVPAAAFSPDGLRVVTGASDKTVKIWTFAVANNETPLLPPLQHEGAVRAAAFSPDGKWVVTGSEDKTARLWNAETGKQEGVAFEHPATVQCVAFSPDGKLLLTGCGSGTIDGDKGEARLWDMTSRQLIDKPLPFKKYVAAVAFAADGKTFVAGSWDGKIGIWKVPAAK